jgi:DNA invertase Pin-like site-specific DNA recombinase
MRNIQPDKKLVQDYVYVQEKLPIDRPVVQYIRQSTDGQVKKNKQSAALQDEQMYRRLVAMGFTDIRKIVKDQGKSGQVMKRTIDDDGQVVHKFFTREGLDELKKLVKTGEVGAIAAFSPSRLYRDLTRKFYTDFVDMLVEYNVPLITYQYIYWPTRRQDMDLLIDKFAEAARFLEEELDGKLLPAKMVAIEEKHSYGGHSLPMGYILEEAEDRKYYVIYEPHAKLIRWLFKRYRELCGNMGKLGRELNAMKFAFPPFEGVDKVPHVGLRRNQQGCYPIVSRAGLVSILTNPAYIGWYVFNEVIISKEAHKAIVDLDDFMYAYERLSSVTLDGQPNENKPKVERRTASKVALLDGLLVSKVGENILPVYVIDNTYMSRQYGETDWETSDFVLSVKRVDRAVTGAILTLIVSLEQRHKEGLQDDLNQIITTLQEEKAAEGIDLQKTLANIRKGIQEAELEKKVALEELYEPGVRAATKQLKLLHAAEEAIELKIAHADKEQAELAKTKDLLQEAVELWEKWDFETRQRFIRLVVEGATMTEVTTHIIRFDIDLREPLGCTLVGYIYKHRGGKETWTDEESATIIQMYPQADRIDILKALPRRTWDCCARQAQLLGVKREKRVNTALCPYDLTYADITLMQEVGLGKDETIWLFPDVVGAYYARAIYPQGGGWYPLTTPDAIVETQREVAEYWEKTRNKKKETSPP